MVLAAETVDWSSILGRVKPIKLNLSLCSLYYVEVCNEFAGPISASLRPGNTAPFEKMSQRWRAVGNTVSNLTGFELQTSRSRDECVTARPTIKIGIHSSLLDVQQLKRDNVKPPPSVIGMWAGGSSARRPKGTSLFPGVVVNCYSTQSPTWKGSSHYSFSTQVRLSQCRQFNFILLKFKIFHLDVASWVCFILFL